MRAERVTWVEEPSDEYSEVRKMWPKHTTWEYKTKAGGDTIFTMDEYDYNIYVAEKKYSAK